MTGTAVHAAFRYTPPGAERPSTGRSPGSRIVACPRLPGPVRGQWHDGGALPGHSCGGSAGFGRLPPAPASLFAALAKGAEPMTKDGGYSAFFASARSAIVNGLRLRRLDVPHWHAAICAAAADTAKSYALLRVLLAKEWCERIGRSRLRIPAARFATRRDS